LWTTDPDYPFGIFKLLIEESKDNIDIILPLLNKAAGVISGGVTEVGNC
jgi:hypothetical protein